MCMVCGFVCLVPATVGNCSNENALSRIMRKTFFFYLCDHKGADQLRSNCEADQHLCFRAMDTAIPPLCITQILRFLHFSVIVQTG